MAQQVKKMRPKRVDEKNSNSVKIAWVIGAVGLCVLLVAGIAVATGGRSNKGPAIEAQSSPTSTTPTGSTPAASKVTIDQVATPPLSIYRARNPFAPLVNQQQPSTTTGAGVEVPVVTVPPELRTGSNGVPETASTAITLESVTKQGDQSVARITVGDQTFDGVAVGQTFGDHYQLLAVGGDSSATILFGDERFTIYTGQSIYL
jgi:hypothetical protein